MHNEKLFDPDGSPRFTNALAGETSPYLLQHAHNPVQWHPWGPAAFELARKLDRPIFLSIGYSTCYWCHVMERQVFENPAIAAEMNRLFVNIKVDREERPDVDDIYMLAVQIMTGHGGWPMSMFLTPPGAAGGDDRGLKPFYAGTYFPPEPMHGRPGFPQVLQSLAEAWQQRRAEVLEQAQSIADGVSEHLGRSDPAGELTIDTVSAAANRLLRSYDAEHGGFGGAPGSPKFPTPSNLFFLLEVYAYNQLEDVWKALAHTLDRMARGGMYDQIGGGFHRYSTDEKWLVPHFEKMLYDNGQLVETYLTARAISPDAHEPGLYERVVRQTCDYVIREMTDATGAFWSAQDAEVDGLEGGNYLWRPPEVAEAIDDPKLTGLAVKMYGLDSGPNFQDPHHAEAPPGNVLFLPQPLDAVACAAGETLESLLAKKGRIDALMLAARNQRKQPSTDDKVLTAWNGMMIAGMARAGRELGEPRYVEAAARAARAVLDLLRTSDGGLRRTMRKGNAKIAAFLDDYAFFIHGLIELHRANADPVWIDAARKLMDLARAKFGVGPEKGGYFDTLADQPDLFVRTRGTYDGAIPSANSQMVHDLLDLHEITRDKSYLDRALLDLASFADAMRRQSAGMPRMQQALLRAMKATPDRFKPGAMRPVNERARRDVVALSVDADHVSLVSGSATILLTLRIGADYHLNAHEPGAAGLIPTTLQLRDAAGFTLDVKYPVGVNKKFPFADRAINVYEGVVTLGATLRAKGPPPPQAVLELRYQVCTEMSCLEPQTAEVVIRIE